MREEELQAEFMKQRQNQLARCYTWMEGEPVLENAEQHTLTNIGNIPSSVMEQIHDFLILPNKKRPSLLFWSHSVADAPILSKLLAAICNDLRGHDTRCLYVEARSLYDALRNRHIEWFADDPQLWEPPNDIKGMAQYTDVLALSNTQRLLDHPRSHVPQWASIIDNRLGGRPMIFTMIDPTESPLDMLVQCLGEYTAQKIARGKVISVRWQESD